MKNKNYNKEKDELIQEIYKLDIKICKLYRYVYNIQRYLSQKDIEEINERYGDLLNED